MKSAILKFDQFPWLEATFQGRSTPEPVAEVPPAGLYIGPPVAAKAA